MADYIVTFFSHFGAIRYKKETEQAKLDSVLMPVPRFLSSSCGTCVRINNVEEGLPLPSHPDEIESAVRLREHETFTTIWDGSRFTDICD